MRQWDAPIPIRTDKSGKQLLPNEVAREDVAQRNYYEKHGSVLLVDYVQKELEKKRTYCGGNRTLGCGGALLGGVAI